MAISLAYFLGSLLWLLGAPRVLTFLSGSAGGLLPVADARDANSILAFAAVTAVGVFWLVQRLLRLMALLAEERGVNAVNARVVELLQEGVMIADLRYPGESLVRVNPAFETITGYAASDAIGKNCRYLQGSDRMQPEIARIREAIALREEVSVSLRNYRKDGTMFRNDLRLAPVFDTHGVATHYVGLMRDITKLHEATSHLQRVLQCDPLTGLANRSCFYEELQALLHEGEWPCVLIAKLDVSGFHLINTSFGWEVGDALLVQIAERLRRWPDALLGRLAGDEFGFATHLTDPAEAEDVIGRLRQAMFEEFKLPGATIAVRFAIGFTLGRVGNSAAALITQVAVALRESKSSRPQEARRYDHHTDILIRQRARLAGELAQAVAESQFVLHYQPKVMLAAGTLVGAEALMRWSHPLFGLQPPDRFIPIAEETGMILDIGAWALCSAAAFAGTLNAGRATPLAIAVNVSPVQIMHRDVEQLLCAVLENSGADPSWITLELTESLFAESSPDLIGALRRVRDLGFGLAIDDFGTGYSSLRYLETFPLTEIKIDRYFVDGLHRSAFRRAVVEAVVKMGRELGAAVTAEGLESGADRQVLLDLGCPFAQGYAFGAPLPEAEFARLAQERPQLSFDGSLDKADD